MKKYTIKDSLGNKKVIYAENVYHAIRLLNDGRTVDMGQHVPGTTVPAHQTYNPEYSIQQFKSYINNVIRDLYGNEYNSQKVRAISKLNAYVSQVIDDFKADIKNSNLDKRKTVQYYTQYVDALYKEITNVTNIQNIDGQSLKKIDDIHTEMVHSIHDSVKDSIHDASYKKDNGVYYKFERGYWRIFSIYNRIKMDAKDVFELARKLNVDAQRYQNSIYISTDSGGYYEDYTVKGKDKNAVIRFCETLNPSVKPLNFEE